MDTYLMMLYVSLDQERAMKKLFSDNGWKYLKPDLLQLTDAFGGMVAQNVSKSSNKEKFRVTSPARSSVTSIITIPSSRPSTRSQKSKIVNRPPAQKTRAKRKASNSAEKETLCDAELLDVHVTKEIPGGQVDDDDFNEYMEYGDEDDDYQDDAGKELKKKNRKLTRNSDVYEQYDNDNIKEEDITEKLDGTEDPDDALLVAPVQVHSKVAYSSSALLDSDTGLTDNLKGVTATAAQLEVISEPDCSEKNQTDAYCLEQAKPSVQNLKVTKSKSLKVEGDNIDEIQNVYGCDECGKMYVNRSSWKRHLKSHQPGIQHCWSCSMYFDSEELLQLHNKKTHSVFCRCNICGLSLARKSCLRKHMLRVHPEECIAKFSCPRSPCKAVFDDEESYNDHLNIHDGNKPHNCRQCQKSFSTRSSLKFHENGHLSEHKTYQCKDCRKTFQSSGALHNHKVSVHEKKRFKCDMCGKVFIYRSGYCKHLVSHKKEKSSSKNAQTSVVRDLKCNDANVKNLIDSRPEYAMTVPQVVGNVEGSDKTEENCSDSNKGDQKDITENQHVDNINQAEISQVNVPQLQTSVLTPQEITGLPLATIHLDPSGQVMWLC